MIETGTASLSHVGIPLDFPARPFVLTAKEFATIADLARTEFGLELGEGKEQLVASRLGKLIRQLGFKAFRDYYRHVLSDRTGDALVELIDALTTNYTNFFREPAHFDFFVERILSEQNRHAPLHIWSAACSTGEEPYSIALWAREHFLSRRPGSQISLPRILATDISTRVLETARRGMYKADRFEGRLAPWLRKHLLRGEARWQGWYRMRPEIREMVEFRRLNLIEHFPAVGRFTVIFCRNVMIYFSRETQEQLVHQLSACLDPGGYLFVGHAESLTGIRHTLQQIQPAVYRERGGKR